MIRTSVVLVTLTLFAVATLGCQDEQHENGRHDGNYLVTDTFQILHEWRSDTLLLSIRSDLPNRTMLMVSVDRHYWRSDSSATYSISYLSEKSRIGAWEGRTHRVVVADSSWRDSLRNLQRLMTRMDDSFTVHQVEDSIRVGFTVPVNQDDPRFGDWNANLRGKAVEEEDGMHFVRKELAFHQPLGEPPRTSPWVHYENLQAGRTYKITEAAMLVPAIEPQDPVAAAVAAKRMPGGTSISVKEIRIKDDTPWYRVEAVGPTGRDFGAGWIASAALLGQDVQRANR